MITFNRLLDGLCKCRNAAIVSVFATALASRCFGFDQWVSSTIVIAFWLLATLAITAEAFLYNEISIGGDTVTRKDYPRCFLILTIFILITDLALVLQLLHGLGVF
jgi:hypothetical protein